MTRRTVSRQELYDLPASLDIQTTVADGEWTARDAEQVSMVPGMAGDDDEAILVMLRQAIAFHVRLAARARSIIARAMAATDCRFGEGSRILPPQVAQHMPALKASEDQIAKLLRAYTDLRRQVEWRQAMRASAPDIVRESLASAAQVADGPR
jgi:hypothetical protein